MIKVNVFDETSELKSVVLGVANNMGPTPSIEQAYDPKSKEHIQNGTFPKEADLIHEMDQFATVLEKHGVKVYRPEVLENTNQIFARDIGFVIEGKFISPLILKAREKEKQGIQYILDQVALKNVVVVEGEVRIEGGDVMPWNDHIFVGYSEEEDFSKYKVSRTNRAGVEFLKAHFPHKIVKSFELVKSDEVARDNALHLDCCFQPVGKNQAIIYQGGFKNSKDYDYLVNYFGRENIIDITQEEMYEMNSNLFSISPNVIVSERGFTRINGILRSKGFIVEEVKYSETSKMEGLLRCSTLPLIRK